MMSATLAGQLILGIDKRNPLFTVYSPEIRAYVRVRWPDLVKEGLYGVAKRLRHEIEKVFGVKLSQETLRPLFGELKRQSSSAAQPVGGAEQTTAGGLPHWRLSLPRGSSSNGWPVCFWGL
jgi:hypothetical protein